MISSFDFHPEAQAEFASDVDWYDDREWGVGGRFADAVRSEISAVIEAPAAWPAWPGWHRDPVVRSKGIGGFPYRLVYFTDGETLHIIAVAHTKRRPGYWRARVRAH